ncbi:MAG: hypothetical protein R3213_01970 [Flavobacteriaceae bacterium]|nr:hypothetical protein [Flavobacteriaceae bacterium]
MKVHKLHFIVTILFLASSLLPAQEGVNYKEIDTSRLLSEVNYPKEIKKGINTAGSVFFNEGGLQKEAAGQSNKPIQNTNILLICIDDLRPEYLFCE